MHRSITFLPIFSYFCCNLLHHFCSMFFHKFLHNFWKHFCINFYSKFFPKILGPEYWDAVKSYLLFSAHFFLKYVLQSFAQYFCTFFYNFNIFPIIFFKIFRAIFFLSLCIFYTISFQTFFQNTITILDAVIASQIFLHPRIWDPHITPVPHKAKSQWNILLWKLFWMPLYQVRFLRIPVFGSRSVYQSRSAHTFCKKLTERYTF